MPTLSERNMYDKEKDADETAKWGKENIDFPLRFGYLSICQSDLHKEIYEC